MKKIILVFFSITIFIMASTSQEEIFDNMDYYSSLFSEATDNMEMREALSLYAEYLNKDIDGNPIERIDGLELINESQNILADISVHLTNGIIDCVEIWNKNGENYPKNEPNKYQLFLDLPIL